MNCPTCGYGLHPLGLMASGWSYWHCRRCGTLKAEHNLPGPESFDVPALVMRCRKFGETLGPGWRALWRSLGIAEAITPEQRTA